MSTAEKRARIASAAVLMLSSIVLAAMGETGALVVIPVLGAIVIVRRIP